MMNVSFQKKQGNRSEFDFICISSAGYLLHIFHLNKIFDWLVVVCKGANDHVSLDSLELVSSHFETVIKRYRLSYDVVRGWL